MPTTRLWLNATVAIHTIAAGVTTAFDLTTNEPAQAMNTTVSRILGRLRYRQSAAGGAFSNVVAGITVVSQQAFTAGVASMPAPADNVVEADWMYVGSLQPFSSASDLSGMPTLEIDNRSQRRRPGTNKVLVLLVRNLGTNTVEGVGFFRVLLTGF